MEEIKLKDNHILRIDYDENSYIESDDINGDVMFLVYDHRDFTVDVEGFEPKEIYAHLNYSEKPTNDGVTEEEFEGLLQEWEDNKPKDFSADYWIWTVYAYIHSGVHLSLSRGYDRWDTSSTGFLLIDKNEFPDEEIAFEHAEDFIKTWNNYLSGNVYRFDLIKQEECGLYKHIHEEYVDSCGGFIGDDEFSCGILENIPKDLITDEVRKLFVF